MTTPTQYTQAIHQQASWTLTLSHCCAWQFCFLKLNQCSANSEKPILSVLVGTITASQFFWTVLHGFITSDKCFNCGCKSITNCCWLDPADRRMCSQLLHRISSMQVQSPHLSQLLHNLIWMSSLSLAPYPFNFLSFSSFILSRSVVPSSLSFCKYFTWSNLKKKRKTFLFNPSR